MLTESGWMYIEDVRVNDRVWSAGLEMERPGSAHHGNTLAVVADTLISFSDGPLIEVQLASSLTTDSPLPLIVSPDHRRFSITCACWVSASQLSSAHQLFLINGTKLSISQVQPFFAEHAVALFDMEIAVTTHTMSA